MPSTKMSDGVIFSRTEPSDARVKLLLESGNYRFTTMIGPTEPPAQVHWETGHA